MQLTGAALKRLVAVIAVVAYVACSAYFLARFALGDQSSHPVAYFFTWDMFPNYPTESSRRAIVAQATDGVVVQLFPNSQEAFCWGVRGDCARLDLDHRPLMHHDAVRRFVTRFLQSDPRGLTHVYIVEQYWPAKYNLPDGLYRQAYGTTNPQRRYWRIVDEAEVTPEGSIPAWESDR